MRSCASLLFSSGGERLLILQGSGSLGPIPSEGDVLVNVLMDSWLYGAIHHIYNWHMWLCGAVHHDMNT